MAKISELRKQLEEAEALYGDIEVVFRSDYYVTKLEFKFEGEFEVGKLYETFDGQLETDDLNVPNEELWEVDLDEPIVKALIV